MLANRGLRLVLTILMHVLCVDGNKILITIFDTVDASNIQMLMEVLRTTAPYATFEYISMIGARTCASLLHAGRGLPFHPKRVNLILTSNKLQCNFPSFTPTPAKYRDPLYYVVKTSEDLSSLIPELIQMRDVRMPFDPTMAPTTTTTQAPPIQEKVSVLIYVAMGGSVGLLLIIAVILVLLNLREMKAANSIRLLLVLVIVHIGICADSQIQLTIHVHREYPTDRESLDKITLAINALSEYAAVHYAEAQSVNCDLLMDFEKYTEYEGTKSAHFIIISNDTLQCEMLPLFEPSRTKRPLLHVISSLLELDTAKAALQALHFSNEDDVDDDFEAQERPRIIEKEPLPMTALIATGVVDLVILAVIGFLTFLLLRAKRKKASGGKNKEEKTKTTTESKATKDSGKTQSDKAK